MAIVRTPTSGHYGVIYSDPPWQFRTWSKKGKGRSADAHYDCLSFEYLCDMRRLINGWSASDCTLLMWTTDPMLPKALKLIEAWGFRYKTVGFYWVKLNKFASIGFGLFHEKDFFTGLGYWTRANPEMCLLATRGAPKRKARDVRRLIVAPRREHSRKPEEVYGRIERLLDGPYLELFGRETHPGWDSFGNEIKLFNEGHVETRRFPSDLSKQ